MHKPEAAPRGHTSETVPIARIFSRAGAFPGMEGSELYRIEAAVPQNGTVRTASSLRDAAVVSLRTILKGLRHSARGC